MEAVLLTIVRTINSYLSNYVLIILLRRDGRVLHHPHARCSSVALARACAASRRLCCMAAKHHGGISSFQAFATAVAAQGSARQTSSVHAARS